MEVFSSDSNKKEGRFPSDWIAPGEYRYCGCGYILLPEGEIICAICERGWGKGATVTEEDWKEAWDKMKMNEKCIQCKKVSDRLHEERNDLAENRRAKGLKRLFWM